MGGRRRIVQVDYAYGHPGLSRTKVEMHFALLDRDEHEEA